MAEEIYIKDPDAVLDYAFDWSTWLDSDSSPVETINSHTITVSAGITKDSDSETDGVITIWLSGGTAGVSYTIACEIVTSAGRTDERSIIIQAQER